MDDIRERTREYMRIYRAIRAGRLPADTPLPSLETTCAPRGNRKVMPDGRRHRPKASSEAERRDRQREQQRSYYTAENAREIKRRHRERHRDRERARSLVSTRIRRGQMVRPDHCQECRTPCRPEAHHHLGYDRPLDVVFLCRPCHVAADAALGSFHVRYPKPKSGRPSRAA